MSNAWWCGQRTGERSISTRRNGSLTLRQEKLASIKRRQIEKAYISDSWQPHSPFSKLVTNLWFSVIVHVLTPHISIWRVNERKGMLGGFFKKQSLGCSRVTKLTLNAKRLNSAAHSSASPLNFATRQQDLWHTGGRAPSHCEELHLERHSELDSWIFIHWLDALIYQAATERNDGP